MGRRAGAVGRFRRALASSDDDPLVTADGLPVTRPGLGIDVGNPHVVVALASEAELASLELHRAPALEPVLPAGANVEFVADWTRGLCAERVALVAMQAAGYGPVVRLYVACTKAPGGSPCGACRQPISDLAPGAAVVLWNGDGTPITTTAAALLPGAFRGDGLARV